MQRGDQDEREGRQRAERRETHLITPRGFLGDAHHDWQIEPSYTARGADDSRHYTCLTLPAVWHELEGGAVTEAEADIQPKEQCRPTGERWHEHGKTHVEDRDRHQQHE